MGDITGKRFGKLIAIRFNNTDKNYQPRWLFECDCGNKKIIYKQNVVGGDTKSCGCFNKEYHTTHGMKKTRFYRMWAMLKNRCLNKRNKDFLRYGGRGICVCDRWLKFENFRDDMYENYKNHVKEFGEKETTIDRIDNNGNYKKDNCKFSTNKEQANNRRNTIYLIYNREKKTLSQWAKTIGVSRVALWTRLNKYNWPLEKALKEYNYKITK